MPPRFQSQCQDPKSRFQRATRGAPRNKFRPHAKRPVSAKSISRKPVVVGVGRGAWPRPSLNEIIDAPQATGGGKPRTLQHQLRRGGGAAAGIIIRHEQQPWFLLVSTNIVAFAAFPNPTLKT